MNIIATMPIDVGERDHAAGALEDAAEDAERRDRHHEDQPVDQQVGEAQRAVELLRVAVLLDVVAGSRSWVPSILAPGGGRGRASASSSRWK